MSAQAAIKNAHRVEKAEKHRVAAVRLDSEDISRRRQTDIAKARRQRELSALDREFFEAQKSKALTKKPSGFEQAVYADKLAEVPNEEKVMDRLLEKPWKKHGNRGKREKMRRIQKNNNDDLC